MKIPVLVREAHEPDLPSAQHVVDLAFETVRHIYRPSPAAQANRPQTQGAFRRLIALYGERIIGTVQYTFDEDRLHLIALATHPDYRQQGVARQIVATLIDIGTRHRQRALSLSTIRETGNRPIFEKMGFDVVLESPVTDLISVQGGRLYEVYMERWLSW